MRRFIWRGAEPDAPALPLDAKNALRFGVRCKFVKIRDIRGLNLRKLGRSETSSSKGRLRLRRVL